MDVSMEWSEEKTLQFIELYRSLNLLWNSRNEFYKNKMKRKDALRELATKFDIEKAEVERKIKNLQSHFMRENKKVVMRKKNGSGAETVYTSKWFAYESLTFLTSRKQRRKNTDSVDTDVGISTADESVDSQLNTCRKRTKFNLEKVPKAYDIMKGVYHKRKQKDEIDLFGEQVACKLRKIKCPHAKVTLEHRINMLLMEGELGYYNIEGFHPHEHGYFSQQYDRPSIVISRKTAGSPQLAPQDDEEKPSLQFISADPAVTSDLSKSINENESDLSY